MTVEDSIFIFANTYSCPLDKRCDGCVFDEMSKIDKRELYKIIIDMDIESRQALVHGCQNCQKEYESLNS